MIRISMKYMIFMIFSISPIRWQYWVHTRSFPLSRMCVMCARARLRKKSTIITAQLGNGDNLREGGEGDT